MDVQSTFSQKRESANITRIIRSPKFKNAILALANDKLGEEPAGLIPQALKQPELKSLSKSPMILGGVMPFNLQSVHAEKVASLACRPSLIGTPGDDDIDRSCIKHLRKSNAVTSVGNGR